MRRVINICHLYPDILNLYGDYGNILCIQKRLLWRDIDCNIDNISVNDKLDINKYDLYFIGGGQDFEQEILLNDIRNSKKELIRQSVEMEKTFLGICGGYQLLGKSYTTWDGKSLDFIGAIDIQTNGIKERMIGDYIFTCKDDQGEFNVIAFENHSGKTILNKEMQPLGKVVKGHGNNGDDKTEGVRYKNVFGTYGHGPLLPKNPRLADLIIKTTLKKKYGSDEIITLDDEMENAANEFMFRRIKSR